MVSRAGSLTQSVQVLASQASRQAVVSYSILISGKDPLNAIGCAALRPCCLRHRYTGAEFPHPNTRVLARPLRGGRAKGPYPVRT